MTGRRVADPSVQRSRLSLFTEPGPRLAPSDRPLVCRITSRLAARPAVLAHRELEKHTRRAGRACLRPPGTVAAAACRRDDGGGTGRRRVVGSQLSGLTN